MRKKKGAKTENIEFPWSFILPSVSLQKKKSMVITIVATEPFLKETFHKPGLPKAMGKPRDETSLPCQGGARASDT